MGFLKKLKKKKVPEELPDLAIDKLKKELQKSEKKRKDALKEIHERKEVSEIPDIEENSFFNKFLKEINQEISNLNELENWYHNKFLPTDVIGEMRNHWESQKNEIVMKTIGKNYKEKIMEKVKNMEQLEKEWQDIYFELMEKEEKIREEEKELKKLLSEFVELAKKRGLHN